MCTKKITTLQSILFAIFIIGGFTYCGQVESEKEVIGFDTGAMQKKISPFTDFDQFANGKWKDTAKLPNGYASWGMFHILNEQNEEKVKDIILKVSTQKNVAGSTEQQIADLYLSYLDTQIIEKKQNEPIKFLITEIDNIKTYKDFITFVAKNDMYVNTFYDFGISADARNSEMNVVYISQGGLYIGDRDYYLIKDERNKTILQEFKSLIKKYLEFISTESSIATSQAEKIEQLETQIAKLHITKEQLRDPVKTYNKQSLEQINKLAPQLFINEFMKQAGVNTDTVIVHNLNYLKNVAKLFTNTDIETLKSWLKFKVVGTFAGYLPKNIVEASRHFNKEVMSGVKTDMSRDKKAIKMVNGLLGELIGKIYADKYFSEKSKSKVKEMIENMRAVYKTRIENNIWMSDSTKKFALKKLASFVYKIGYPDKWKDYSNIKIDKTALIENIINIYKWEYNYELSKVGKPVDRTEWGMTPQMVNAYYNPSNNEIVFPAGILQPPFYNPNADDAINYGGILAVIGHEFTHGFDDEGSQFDEKGNLKVWWLPSDRKKFEDKAKIVGNIYNQYDGLKSKAKINGLFTMGENIADLGGITLAYYALLKSIEGKEPPKNIDGFNYKQRFFLGWAQVWRAICTDEYEKNQIIGDPHSPAKARINVTTSMLNEFYDAWKDYAPTYVQDPKKIVVIW